MSFLIRKKAPDFETTAVVDGKIVNGFTLKQFHGHYVLLFFYPLDFTFVCPTELHAFQKELQAFEARNCKVIGCSIDSPYSHLAWLRTPMLEGGIEGVHYPLISDMKKSIAKDYGVLCEEEGVAFRGLFLINREGIVRHQLINDLPIGRSVEEALRVLDACIFSEAHGEVCPANWHKDNPGMQASDQGVRNYFSVATQRVTSAK